LRSLPLRILYHAMCHFRAECPQRQPSIITTEFYLSQVKDALVEGVYSKVYG
jgi:hypothetical protein